MLQGLGCEHFSGTRGYKRTAASDTREDTSAQPHSLVIGVILVLNLHQLVLGHTKVSIGSCELESFASPRFVHRVPALAVPHSESWAVGRITGSMAHTITNIRRVRFHKVDLTFLGV